MRIVLWIGNESNQRALACKIHAEFPLCGIVTETRKSRVKWTITSLFEKLYEKLFLSEIGKAWWGMKSFYNGAYPNYPKVKSIDVENINSTQVYQFTKDLQPDLIIVSGTRLVKEKLLSIHPSIGILNLHTGLSPYIKGGPNCTNWCIATEQFHMIGNTIMWIDAGIDTGNIITTECTALTGEEDLSHIHIKVMDHAHELYLKAVRYLAAGKHKSISQNTIAQGKTYYTKDWGLLEKMALLRNMKKFHEQAQNGSIRLKQRDLNAIAL